LNSAGICNSIFDVLFLKREVIFFMAHHSHKYEREYQRKRGLQREVLEHLKRYSPKKWDTLYSYFAKERGANIQPVLHALKDARYIKVSEDEDQIVRITASGLKRLEQRDH
jgi:hypothetical protein